MKKIKKGYDEDMDRLAYHIFHDKDNKNKIIDAESFSDAYEDYLEGKDIQKNEVWKRGTYQAFLNNKDIPPKYRERARKQTSKIITSRTQKLRREEVPSKRIIRTRRKMKRTKKRTLTFNIPASQKGRTVYARRIKTKVGIRYVTKKGWRAKKL